MSIWFLCCTAGTEVDSLVWGPVVKEYINVMWQNFVKNKNYINKERTVASLVWCRTAVFEVETAAAGFDWRFTAAGHHGFSLSSEFFFSSSLQCSLAHFYLLTPTSRQFTWNRHFCLTSDSGAHASGSVESCTNARWVKWMRWSETYPWYLHRPGPWTT